MGDTKSDPSGTGSAPPRPKRSETRFCRTPQWLYGTGISLQAIAAYGWLHGKYGYLPRINPSYATLAEELGVSRGSVITYFKELIRVGAVRVTVGGPKGRTINSYEIAFDTPFASPSGQRADHSEADTGSVVSGLTTTSQRADQTDGLSGQRAVPDKEAFKNLEDSLSSHLPQRTAEEPPVTDEREIIAALPKDNSHADAEKVALAWRHTRGGPPVRQTETAIRKAATELLADGHDLEHLCQVAVWMVTRNYVRLADAMTHPDAPKHASAAQRPLPGLPPWCGECGDKDPAAETDAARRYHHLDDGSSQRCHCHPAHRKAA